MDIRGHERAVEVLDKARADLAALGYSVEFSSVEFVQTMDIKPLPQTNVIHFKMSFTVPMPVPAGVFPAEW